MESGFRSVCYKNKYEALNIHVYIYMDGYIERERQRDRETERQRERETEREREFVNRITVGYRYIRISGN